MPYFNIAIRSGPIPNANPVYFLESKPAISKTFGWTSPAPKISIQPVCLQTEQPSPLQTLQEMSISTDGSVNGKKLGRRRISRSSPNRCFARTFNAVSYTHLRAHETDSYLVCRLLLEKNFFNDTATTEIYTSLFVGSVRCV